MMDKTDHAHTHLLLSHTQMQSRGTSDGGDRPTIGFRASGTVGNDLIWTNQREGCVALLIHMIMAAEESRQFGSLFTPFPLSHAGAHTHRRTKLGRSVASF